MSRPKTPATCSDPICRPNRRRVAKFKRSGGQNGWAAALFFWARNSWHGMVDWCLPTCDRIWCQLFITIELRSYIYISSNTMLTSLSMNKVVACIGQIQSSHVQEMLVPTNRRLASQSNFWRHDLCLYYLTFLQGQSTPCRDKDCRKQCDQSSCTVPSLAKKKVSKWLDPLSPVHESSIKIKRKTGLDQHSIAAIGLPLFWRLSWWNATP